MSEAISGLFWLRDPRLAPLALGPWPAWAWSLDGTRILFANPTGAAIFGAETPTALAACRFARTRLSDGTDAILIAATEQAGPELSLAKRVAYHLAETNAPVAAFAPDGTLIEATAAAQA